MAKPVRVSFLGGLGEIGRNCAAIEIDDAIMLIDCGILFPDSDTAGIDLVLPISLTCAKNADKVIGAVLTHGHEDHIGALSFLLEDVPLKLFGSELTIGLAKNRISEKGVLDRCEFVPVKDNQRIKSGPFDMEFFPVTHSVPHGFATAFHTPQGVILHSGDFKLDMSPVDSRRTDLSGLGHLAEEEGIRLFLCDSTNAEEEGFSESETSIGESIGDLFRARSGRRIIVACFASHIHRIQQIADAAIATGRTIATLGLSMKKNVALAREMGLLNIPDNKLIDIDDISGVADEKLCIISTGSQGEPLSALARMAAGDSHWLTMREGDCVILSSHPIPGNEFSVTRVIDSLVKRGAEVVHSGTARVHATGHAKAEELRVMHSIVKPEWFVPVHGEYRHMAQHARIAEKMGTAADKIVMCSDGDSLNIGDKGITRAEDVPAEYVYIAGKVGEVDHNVITERRVMGQDGFVSVIVAISIVGPNAELMREPEVVSRGWVDGPEGDELRKAATLAVREAIESAIGEGKRDRNDFERVARRTLGRFINRETRLRPMVVPVILGAHEAKNSRPKAKSTKSKK